jgi:peptidoglycan hydrolase CwlO-like protein
MNRRTLPIAAALFIAAAVACATNAHAQAQTQTPPPTPAQPAAQDSAAPPATPQPPAKKVWSNDDMKDFDPHSGVSTVGKLNTNPAKSGSRSSSAIHDPQWYKNKIAQLQAQVPPLEKQIAELQAAIDGKPTGDAAQSTRPSGVKFDSWANELAQFQKKRDDLLAQIAALQDDARHNGVPAKDIP